VAQRGSVGKCSLCSRAFDASVMTRHLKACAKAAAGPKAATCFHLVVEGGWGREYWLHLAVPVESPFSGIDYFLRNIWLECCGHMSAFRIAGESYSRSPLDSEEFDMGVALKRVLKIGMKFWYEYDFGSTTELQLKVAGVREFPVERKHPVLLLARNDPPEVRCEQCGQARAERICSDCQWSGKGWLCAACARKHRCESDYLLPVVNSPRAGVCGYTG